ncbi:unnamed protein product [Clonostachys rhizophaga]|uniref:Uncharacterized protein n=1 Tax=Clonostachys rhizophaga TaxID=160324 RepID=A0A9N9VMR9_9HYPO|nr:unnamed protein product [Clonostachys rhizophaga]
MARVTSLICIVLLLRSFATAKPLHHRAHGSHSHKLAHELVSLSGDNTGPVIRSATESIVLKPLRPSRGRKSARDGMNAFEVLSEDYLYWAGSDGTVTELKVDMSGAKEGLVDTEYWSDLVESMDCPNGNGSTGVNGTEQVTVRFSEKLDFDDAADIWKWVKQDEERQFVLMVGAGDCGWNEDRILYQINDIGFDDPANTAMLRGKSISWKDALHTFELHIGKSAVQSAQAQRTTVRRGLFDSIGDVFSDIGDALKGEYNPDVSIPFEHDLSGKSLSFPVDDGLTISGTCSNCSTSGTFNIEGRFRVKFFKLKEAVIELSTEGIDVTTIIQLGLKGDLTDALVQKSLSLLKLSPGGVSIPGILTIGPTVAISLDAGISAIKGAVKLTMGGTASIPASKSTLDFLAEDKTTSTGWDVQMSPSPLEADASIEAGASAALTASVGLELTALETGFAAQLSAALPKLSAALQAISSLTCNACKKYSNAISGSVGLSTSLSLDLRKKMGSSYKNLWSLTLAEKTLATLASFCEPVGPQTCAVNGTYSLAERWGHSSKLYH